MVKQQKISVGKISGVFGIKGWLKVFSYTDPRENILNYSPWLINKGRAVQEINVAEGKRHGKLIVALLEDINDRDQAEALSGWDVSINYRQLPETETGEYYWADLVGLKVETTAGVDLGIIDHLIETGANDVLVVTGQRESLIPFLQPQTVKKIDLDLGMMIVDWDPDF